MRGLAHRARDGIEGLRGEFWGDAPQVIVKGGPGSIEGNLCPSLCVRQLQASMSGSFTTKGPLDVRGL